MIRPVLTVKAALPGPIADNPAIGEVPVTHDPVATALAAFMYPNPNPWGLYGLANRKEDAEQ